MDYSDLKILQWEAIDILREYLFPIKKFLHWGDADSSNEYGQIPIIPLSSFPDVVRIVGLLKSHFSEHSIKVLLRGQRRHYGFIQLPKIYRLDHLTREINSDSFNEFKPWENFSTADFADSRCPDYWNRLMMLNLLLEATYLEERLEYLRKLERKENEDFENTYADIASQYLEILDKFVPPKDSPKTEIDRSILLEEVLKRTDDADLIDDDTLRTIEEDLFKFVDDIAFKAGTKVAQSGREEVGKDDFESTSNEYYKDDKTGRWLLPHWLERSLMRLQDEEDTTPYEPVRNLHAWEPTLQHYGYFTRWLDLVDNLPIAIWFASQDIMRLAKGLTNGVPPPSQDPPSTQVGYIFLYGINIDKTISRGMWEGNIARLVDLREATHPNALRPHVQHAFLMFDKFSLTLKKKEFSTPEKIYQTLNTIDLTKYLLCVLEIPTSSLSSWVENSNPSNFLAFGNLFPSPDVDPLFCKLLRYDFRKEEKTKFIKAQIGKIEDYFYEIPTRCW